MARKRAIKWNIMIARISILILLLTLLPDLYIYRRYLRWRFDMTLWMRLLWWVPGAAMIACTAAYSMMRNFAPDNLTLFNVYLFMLGCSSCRRWSSPCRRSPDWLLSDC